VNSFLDHPAGLLASLRARYGDRALGIALTVLLELALIAVLLTLGLIEREEPVVVSSLTMVDIAAPPAAQTAQDQAQDSPDQPAGVVPPVPMRPSPLRPQPSPLQSPSPEPTPEPQPSPQPEPSPSPSRPGTRIREGGGAYGPPGTSSRNSGDSEVVGIAPDGSPLYAARWFREPTDRELQGYLSTVAPPAWALIACRTAPGWAVVDCVPVSQSSPSSNIMNAVLASTWQLQVRPPRRGNQSLVGSWVRIRISYGRD